AAEFLMRRASQLAFLVFFTQQISGDFHPIVMPEHERRVRDIHRRNISFRRQFLQCATPELRIVCQELKNDENAVLEEQSFSIPVDQIECRVFGNFQFSEAVE
ncbi:hypothetical protein ACC673_37365, partial [Rhizobium ruizarguesonis]